MPIQFDQILNFVKNFTNFQFQDYKNPTVLEYIFEHMFHGYRLDIDMYL